MEKVVLDSKRILDGVWKKHILLKPVQIENQLE